MLVRYLLDAGICGEGERAFLELERTLTATTDGSSSGIAAADDKFGSLTCIQGTVRTSEGRFVQTVDSRYPTSITGGDITDAMSGMKRMLPCGRARTISTAFDEVTHTSDQAFISVVELT